MAEHARESLGPDMENALRETPKGAFALAGLTVALLLIAWLAIYILVFLPRGMVG